jgi:hypothetical protein
MVSRKPTGFFFILHSRTSFILIKSMDFCEHYYSPDGCTNKDEFFLTEITTDTEIIPKWLHSNIDL